MNNKMEKDADSMVVKNVEYAASEYSASSEPPPAYRLRQANSVKIAKIVACTVILSSLIFGSFMLASTYLQAKATCDQVSALDAILEKELMLESMQQQDLPHPEALLSKESASNMLQDLSKDEMNKPNKKDETNPDDVETINADENDENEIDNDEMKRIRIKLPLDFDLSELAHNLLMQNQKSRMNCVVERRRTEEVDEPKPMNPFNAFMMMNEPKKEKVTGERIAIFCESGMPKSEPEVVQIRRIVMPFPPMMNRFAAPPQQMPPPQFQQFNPMNMPPRFPPQQFNPMMNMPQPPPQLRIPFQFQQQQPQQPPMMSPPRPEVPQFRLISPAPPQQAPPQIPTFERPQETFESQSQQQLQQRDQQEPQFRIQLRRIQIPGPIGDIFPFLNKIHGGPQSQSDEDDIKVISSEEEAPRQSPQQIQVHQMPLAVALSKVGITPDDLRNIQRMAEEKFQEHLRELVAEEENDSSSDSENESTQSEEDTGNQNLPVTSMPEQSESEEIKKDEAELHEAQPEQVKTAEEQQILPLDSSNFSRGGRSLSLAPVQLPGRMDENAELQEAERADFVHPR